METIKKNGTVFVLVPKVAWQKIASGNVPMPELPEPNAQGNRPALQTARVLIARGIIRDRTALGWSQGELARQSGIPVATLNRIERATRTADPSTIAKIDKALKARPARAAHPKVVGRKKAG